MKAILRHKLANSKRRIQRRLDKTDLRDCSKPMMTASNIHYEIADRSRGISIGGIRAIHALAHRTGLIDAIDQRLQLLTIHLPYHESDHVLALAYLPLCGGTCLEDLELLRHDEVFLDALGARRIPDPTPAGDFCRRFTKDTIQTLLDIIDGTRLRVWAGQPAAFFEQATIDMDGFLVETTGQCKRGMDIAYDGTWGYHALVLTLANTGEALSVGHIGSQNVVFVHCYAMQQDFSNWLPTFELLNDSFQYDDDYRFTAHDDEASVISNLGASANWNGWGSGAMLGGLGSAIAGLVIAVVRKLVRYA